MENIDRENLLEKCNNLSEKCDNMEKFINGKLLIYKTNMFSFIDNQCQDIKTELAEIKEVTSGRLNSIDETLDELRESIMRIKFKEEGRYNDLIRLNESTYKTLNNEMETLVADIKKKSIAKKMNTALLKARLVKLEKKIS